MGASASLNICCVASARSRYHPPWFEYLISRGHRVVLISPDTPSFPIPGVKIFCFPQFKHKTLRLAYTFLFGGLFIRNVINKEKPDILHAIELDECFAAAASGFHPFVMSPHGTDLLFFAKKYILFKLLARFIHQRADLVVCDSEVLRRASLNLSHRKVNSYVVQWGVDLTQFHLRLNRNTIREKYNIGDAPLVLSARGITPEYNLETVVKSFIMIVKKIPSAKLMFVYAFTDTEAELKKLVTELGLSSSTIFVGAVSYKQIPEYFAAADVFVSVPPSDSSPRAVYEAMACGVPPVVSDLPWTKDLIKPEENALIVPTYDVQALASALIRLLEDKVLRQKIIAANIKLVDEKLNYHKHMAKLESIYLSLVESAGRKR